MLEIRNLTLKFGGLTAINDVSFKVEENQIFAIIGPNGAGKTSLFNSISGIYTPTTGEILLEGRNTKKSWRKLNLILLLLSSFLCGLLTVIVINLNSIWQLLVLDLTSFGDAFPWIESAKRGLGLLYLPYQFFGIIYGPLPLLICFILGGCCYRTIWKSKIRSSDYIARLGIGRTFQNIRLFSGLTVLENLLVSIEASNQIKNDAVGKAKEVLKFVELEGIEDKLPNSLPYGHQRRLEIARAIISSPKLLLLDEPAAGMNPVEGRELVSLIRKIRDSGITVILIEHHMKVVMEVSERILVLNYGNKIAEGTPEEIKNNQQVIEAYLGSNL
jgi:branched-chain amino acid transport system ATP-binding protein